MIMIIKKRKGHVCVCLFFHAKTHTELQDSVFCLVHVSKTQTTENFQEHKPCRTELKYWTQKNRKINRSSGDMMTCAFDKIGNLSREGYFVIFFLFPSVL